MMQLRLETVYQTLALIVAALVCDASLQMQVLVDPHDIHRSAWPKTDLTLSCPVKTTSHDWVNTMDWRRMRDGAAVRLTWRSDNPPSRPLPFPGGMSPPG